MKPIKIGALLVLPAMLLGACKKEEPAAIPSSAVAIMINGKPWQPAISGARLLRFYTVEGGDSNLTSTRYSMELTRGDTTLFIVFGLSSGLEEMHPGVFSYSVDPRSVENTRPCWVFLGSANINSNVELKSELRLHSINETARRVSFDFNSTLRANQNGDLVTISGSLQHVRYEKGSFTR